MSRGDDTDVDIDTGMRLDNLRAKQQKGHVGCTSTLPLRAWTALSLITSLKIYSLNVQSKKKK